jgi:hypothetical protein
MPDTASPAAASPRPTGFVRALFTERDNKTWDLKRVLWALGVLVFLIRAGTVSAWDGWAFASQFGIVLGAGGATLALNRKNENGAPS